MAYDFRRDRPDPEPKPFGKVVVNRSKAAFEAREHDSFHSNSYSGTLTCALTVLTPVHIGSGIYELDETENPVRGQITVGGKAFVPGSSLKGAIRSIAEAVSDSCFRITRSDAGRNLSVTGAQACPLVMTGKPARLCVCCSIFGALGYQGRVSFTDARLVRGATATHRIQSPYPPRDSARQYKDAQRRFNGRKFYYHGQPVEAQRGEPYQVVVKNSEFEFAMSFESLSDAELCLLLVAMGIFDDIVIKVGGGKQAMLGSVEIVPSRLELQRPKDSFLDFSGGVEVIEDKITSYLLDNIGHASQLVNESALDELMKIWKWPSDRKAPVGIY